VSALQPPTTPAVAGAAAPPTNAPPTNTLAILALVLALIVPVGGIVCGHLALAQVKRTGEPGRDLALAGLIVGYVLTGIAVLVVILMIVFTIWYVTFFAALFSAVATTSV